MMFSLAKAKLLGKKKAPTGPILKECEKFMETMFDAITSAHDVWRPAAYFIGIKINGPVAMGGPLQGPELGSMITPFTATVTGIKGNAAKYAKAISKGVGLAWSAFMAGVFVPGLPWYPSFAAVPGPRAPLMPNVPTPLAACARGSVSALSTSNLVTYMNMSLGEPGDFSTELFESIAAGLSLGFTVWVGGQVIMNVMGTGPVPTFAPPYVPVGPVSGGEALPTPGVLAA